MSVFEKNHRARVYTSIQHPFKHTLTDFAFTHGSMPGVVNVEQAISWMVTVLYPRTQSPVATPAALPAGGNTIGDYRVVLDDGDTRAAGYQWQQREGDVAAQWYKIGDMDWGVSTIVSQYLLKTQDLYIYRYGYDDTDVSGALYTGDLAGQRIYGGAAANSHLILYANSGDGVGTGTGFIQFGDNARPITDSTFSLGTTTYRFLKVWSDEVQSGTLNLSSGSITDSSGAISFDNENLTTTGSMTAASFSSSGSGVFGTLTVAGGSITDSTGAISFSNENLSTSGNVTVGTMLIAGGSITDSSGVISFDNENISTTGSITGGSVAVDSLLLNGSTLSVSLLNTSLILIANGTGVVDVQSAMTTIGQTVTGTVGITGQLNIDNLRLDGNTISSTDVNGNVILDPNGSGLIELGASFYPTTDSSWDIGKTGNVWNKLWLDGSIGDGTNEITVANLLTFRAVGTPGSGDTLFWDGSKWVASAPDTEIDHGSISGLAGDDHTQYSLLLGRAGGQSLIGGTGSGDDLTLTSTSNVTLGDIIIGSRLFAGTDNLFDIGGTSNRFKDLYLAGQAYGLRAQNATTAGAPSASAGTKGRLYFNTDESDLFVDLGGSWKKISIEKHEFEDAVTWDGATSSKVYTVSADVSDARKCIWALYSNSDTFNQVQVDITKSQTQVTITAAANLPVGTYTLIGIG